MTSPKAQYTDFSKDVLGRYVCNGLDEALHSADSGGRRPDASTQEDARPFDVIVVGGGSFGPIMAQHLFNQDRTHSHRILVLEAGPLSLPEHVQNLPMIGLGVPGTSTTDPGQQNEVWGLPWLSDIGFPGLAYTLGGRSVFFGGWSPELLVSETDTWPSDVLKDLRNGSDPYLRQAGLQIGVNESNDFIFGDMHKALRKELFDGIKGRKVHDAIPLDDPDLPLHLDGVPAGQENLFKLEAPLAVQGRAPRSGFFPMNKFSAVPLIMEAARAATYEAFSDDVKKRFMIVPFCHVTRLETQPVGDSVRVVGVLTNQGRIPVSDHGVVVIAMGTIESSRLALTSFPLVSNAGLIGTNLMAHLRSNLTIRIPASSLPAGLGGSLEASALFVKGRHTFKAKDGSLGHFHLQITASGFAKPGADSEAELFKKNPDIDLFGRLRRSTDTSVVITIRAIGEMQPHNPDNRVSLSGQLDEFGLPRAWVTLKPNDKDNELWIAMDTASDDVAKIFAAGKPYEVYLGGSVFTQAVAGQDPKDLLPFLDKRRRDGLGTTHHEAGTLWMGENPTTSVTNADGRFHFVENAYAAGPAVGSPNPMLTGTALARRLADRLSERPSLVPDAGFKSLFDGATTDRWQMSTIVNQPGRDNPGRFLVVDAGLEAVTGTDLGLYWCTEPTPANFVLRLEWLSRRDDDNSGIFVRFPDPRSKGYDNTAFVGVDFGFEIQIDQLARNDGNPIHKTGAVYGLAAPTDPDHLPVRALGEWNLFEIKVVGQTYDVSLNGHHITHYENTDSNRGLPTTPTTPSFIGLQTHTGRVAFRNIEIKPL